MKFYSEITNKVYDTEEELNQAELNVSRIKQKVKETEKKKAEEKDKELKAIAAELKSLIGSLDELANCKNKVDQQIETFLKAHNKNISALTNLNIILDNQENIGFKKKDMELLNEMIDFLDFLSSDFN